MDKPIATFRAGALQAAIFNNARKVQGKDVEIPSVTMQKRFNKDGEWNTSKSLDLNDLPKAILVLSKAYDYLLTKKAVDEVIENDTSEPQP